MKFRVAPAASVLFVASVLLLAGCSTIYTGIVTITEIRDSAMKEIAQLYKQDLVDPATAAKFEAADVKYLQAAAVAELALVSFKNGGDQHDYVRAIEALRDSVGGLLGLLQPFLAPAKTTDMRKQLEKATKI